MIARINQFIWLMLERVWSRTMLNQMILVGRVANLEVNDEGKAILMLAVPRSFKNAYGEFETDILKCRLYGAIATNTK